MTKTRTLVIVSVGALLAVAGCKKDSKPADKGPEPHVAGPMSDDLRAVLAMMPLDSEMIAGVDFTALRGTDIYAAHEGDLKGLAATQLELISKLCDFDPTDKIGSVVFAGKGKTKTGDLTALVRGLSKTEVLGCLTKASAAPPVGVVITVDGDFAMIESIPEKPAAGSGSGTGTGTDTAAADMEPPPVDDAGVADPGTGTGSVTVKKPAALRGQSISIKFLDDTTALIGRRKGQAIPGKALDAIAASQVGDGVTKSDAFMAIFKQVDTTAPVWFTVLGSAPLLKSVSKYIPFTAAFGSVRVGTGVDLDLTARMLNDKAAADISAVATRTLDNLKKSTLRDAIGPTTVKVTGQDVRITLSESGPQLKSLISKGSELMLTIFSALLK